MTKEDLDILKVTKWECPSSTGVPLITMPNVPTPLHGLPPRKIMGKTAWDRARKMCYFKANYKCEICGCDPAKGNLHAHELYTIDYLEGTSTFNRCIAICKEDHDFIHSGRLVTLFKEGNMLYQKKYVLRVVEKGFKLISDYNKAHPDEEPIRAFDTFLDYLRVPELAEEMEHLINKYDMKFYSSPKRPARWDKWRLVWNGKEYKTPYKDHKEWEEAMKDAAKNDVIRQAGGSDSGPFSGGVYDELRKLLEQSA